MAIGNRFSSGKPESDNIVNNKSGSIGNRFGETSVSLGTELPTSSTYLSNLDPQAGSTKDYAEYFPTGGYSMKDMKALDYARATQQPFWEQGLGFINQSFAEIGGGTVEGIGYLLDIPGWISSIKGTEEDFGNWFSDIGKSWKEAAREATPIYQEAPGEFSPGDPAWWFGNGVSVVSSLSLLIPAMGAVKGLGTVGKAMGLTQKLSAGQKIMTKSIAGATFSRHMENTMEASQVFNEVYNEHLASGLSESQAKENAAKAASHTYKYNWFMIGQDIMQFGLFNGAFKASTPASYKTLRAAGKTKTQAAVGSMFQGYGLGKDMLMEGIEEGYQFVVSQEGKYLADSKAGLVEESEFSERMNNYLRDGEMWTSFVFGALGAGVMQTAGKPITRGINNMIYGKLNENIDANVERINEIKQRGATIKQMAAQLKTANDLNDRNAKATILKNGTFGIAWKAAKQGNLKLAKEQLNKFKESTQEEKDQFGVNEDFVSELPQMEKDFDRIGHLYETLNSKLQGNTKLAEVVAHKMFMVEHLSEEKAKIESEISANESKFPGVDRLSTGGLEAFRLKSKIEGYKQTNKTLDVFIKQGLFASKNERDAVKKEIKSRGLEIKEAELAFKKLIDGDKEKSIELSKEDKEVLKSAEGFFADDIFKAISRSQLIDTQLKTYQTELAFLNDKNKRKELEKSIAETEKKAVIDAQQAIDKQKEREKARDHAKKTAEEKGEVYDEKLEDILYAINNGEIKRENLSPEIQSNLLMYEKNKSADKENKDYTEKNTAERENKPQETFEPILAEGVSFEKEQEKIEHAGNTKLATSFALAWKSTNNRETVEGEGDKALTDFLEGDYNLNDVELIFSIDFDYLESRKDPKYKKSIIKQYELIERAIIDNKTNQLKEVNEELFLGIPIKAELYRKGTPLVHKGTPLVMHLHTSAHDFNEEVRAELIEEIKQLKTKILEGYEGVTQRVAYSATGLFKARGHIYWNEGGTELSDTFPNLDKTQFVYGNIDGKFYNAKGEILDDVFSESEAGSIYGLAVDHNGNKVPIKLNATKLTTSEAELIYEIMDKMVNEGAFGDTRLSKEFIESITENPNAVISEIDSYLDLSKVTYNELLDTLVLAGYSKTKGKGQSTLFTTETGNIVFGNQDVTATKFREPAVKKAFIAYLTNARVRQVNVSRLDNKDYKKYLSDHKILTSNVETTPEGNIFVQPTISFSGELRPATDNSHRETIEVSEEVITEEELSNVELDEVVFNVGAEVNQEARQQLNTMGYSNTQIDSLSRDERATILKEGIAVEDFIPETSLPNVGDLFTDISDQTVRVTPEELSEDTPEDKDWDSDVDTDEDSVFRTTSSTANFIDIQDEAAHIRNLLPKEIGIQLESDYKQVLSGGSIAIGMFRDNMITLATNNLPGTAYHEAFHAVFRTMLTSKQQTELYNESSKVYSIDELKVEDLIINHNIDRNQAILLFYEEAMADSFMEYMLAKNLVKFQTGANSRLTNFFERLFNWVKKVFSKKSNVDNLFDNIAKGKYKNKPIVISRSVAFRRHKEFTPKEVKEVVQALAYAAMDNVIDLSNVDQINLEKAKRQIKILGKKYKESGNEEMRSRAKKVYDHFDSFFAKEVVSYIKMLGLKAKRTSEEEGSEDEDGNITIPNSWEVSGKEKMSASVKFMLSMIPKLNSTESIITKEGKTKYIDYDTNNYLGVPSFEDFGSVFNTVKELTSNIVDYTDEEGIYHEALELMLDKLISFSKHKPNMMVLVSKLKEANYKVQSEFFSVMSSQKSNFITTLFSGNTGNYKFKYSNSDVGSRSKVILAQWGDFFADIIGNRKGFTTEYSENTINTILQDLSTLSAESNRKFINAEKTEELKQDILNFLESIGVTIQPRTLEYHLNEISPNPRTSILKFVGDLNRAFVASSGKKGLIHRRGEITESNNHILDEKSFFEKLAHHESLMQNFSGEGTFVGAGGNLTYIYSDHHMASKLLNKMRSGDIRHIREVLNTPYGKNSLWAKDLLESETLRSSFGLELFGNFKEENAGDQGDKASDLKEIDTMTDIVNKYLSGYFIGLAEADKTRQQYFKGPKAYKSDLLFNQQTGQYQFKSANPRAVEYLFGYFKDEVARMNKVWADLNDLDNKLKPEELVVNKHYTKEPGDHNRTTPNGLKSYLFPQLDLEKIGITIQGKPVDVSELSSNKELNTKITEYIKDRFINAVNNDVTKLVTKGVLGMSNSANVINKTLDVEIVNRYKQKVRQSNGEVKEVIEVRDAIADFTLNSIIANVEQTKLFNGDPALYKAKEDIFEDFKKRIPAVYSAGKSMRIFTDPHTGTSVRRFYRSATIANIDKVPSEFFSKEENLDVILESLPKDSNLTKEEIKRIFAPYKEINRTDAQAWITLDARRERMIGYGKWNNKLQKAYNRVSLGQLLSEDLELIAQPLKTVHTELVLYKGEHVLQYNKQSEAVLLPGLIRGTDLERLNNAMEGQKIDHIIVLDGKKSGAIGVSKIVDDKGVILPEDQIKLNGVSLSNEYLFLQQDLPTKKIGPTLVGSQAVKNLMGGIKVESSYFNDSMTGLEFYSEYNTVITTLSNLETNKLLKEVTFDGYTLDEDKLRARLLKDNRDDLSDNIIEALEQRVPFDLVRAANFESKLTSDITKKTVKMKQLGGALIQMSDFGVIGREVSLTDKVKEDIIWLKNPKEQLKSMRLRKDDTGVIKTRSAQVLLSHTKLLQLLDDMGIDYKSMSHSEIKKLISRDVLKGISYRIPNQATSSNDAFEIVGFLPPSMGDTIISYSEITTKTGSDFDIDKVFIMLPNFKVKYNWKEIWKELRRLGSQHSSSLNEEAINLIKNKKDRSEAEQGALDFYENNLKSIRNKHISKIVKIPYDKNRPTKEGLQNRRIELMREVLMHPETFVEAMTPLDTKWLSNLVNGVEGKKGLFPADTQNIDLSFFSGITQAETKSTFDKAKSLVGVIANHMTHHKLAAADQLYFDNYYLGKGNKGIKEIETIVSTEKSNPSLFTNYSGAAKGSDSYWENVGKKYKIGKQVNYRPEDLKKLTKEQLETVEKAYQEVVKTLGRKPLDPTTYSGGLVRRDYLQARKADAVFAIIEDFDNNGYVKGGTAYAVVSALNMRKPVYVFNQSEEMWYSADYSSEGFENWTSSDTPILTRNFAGIGTRELKESGKKAIEEVYEKTFSSMEKATPKTFFRASNESLLDSKYDEDGNLIEETLGGFMNAIVDAPKDPFVTRTNLNLYTANLTFMLARAGFSREWIPAFTGQPILKRLVEVVDAKEGRLSEVNRINGKKETAIDVVAKEFGLNNVALIETLKNKEGQIVTTFEALEKQISNPSNDFQLKVLGQFIEWQAKAKELNDVIVASKADVSGARKNLSSALLADAHLLKVANGPIGNIDKLFGFTIEDGKLVFDDSRIMGTYHKNSAQLALDLYSGQFLNLSEAFFHAGAEILTGAGYTDLSPNSEGEMLLDTINNSLFGALISDFFVPLTPEEIEELVLDVNTAKEKHKDNIFLSSLDIRNKEGVGLTVGLSNKNFDKDAKNNLFIDWENLLRVDSELGERLVRYAYTSSGFRKTLNSFYEYIPTSFLTEIGYHTFLKDKLKQLNEDSTYMDKYIRSVYKNNVNNNRLVPVIQDNEFTVPEAVKTIRTSTGKPQLFTVNMTNGSAFIAGQNKNGGVEFKRFIKIRENRSDTLYELIGYLPTEKGRKAIYLISQKQGVQNRGNYIVEYNTTGVSKLPQNKLELSQELLKKVVALREDLNKGFEYPEPVIGNIRQLAIYKKKVSDEQVEKQRKRCGQYDYL